MPLWDLDHYSWQDVNWGDVPTFLALVAAVAAAWIGLRVYRIESHRDRQATSDRRKDQAARVGVWIEEVADDGTGTGTDDAIRADRYWRLTIRNGSDLPIYDVFVSIDATPDFTDSPRVFLVGKGYDLLAPGDTTVRLEPAELARPATADPPDRPTSDTDPAGTDLHITLRFRDSAGLAWRRGTQGRLIEVTDDGADDVDQDR